MSKISKKILIPAVLLLIVLIAALAVRQMYDARQLGLMALEHIGTTNGLNVCRAEDFKLSLLRGLEIGDVEIRGKMAGGEWNGTIERLVLAHQLGPLLSGTLQIDEIAIIKPSFELITGPTTEPAGTGAGAPVPPAAGEEEASAEEGSGLALVVSSIRIENANFRTYDTSLPDEDTKIQNFDLTLRDITVVPGAAPAIERLVASGELRAETVRSGDVVADGARGRLSMSAGQLEIADFKLDLPQGEIGANVKADLTKDPFPYTLTLTGEPLFTHKFLGLEKPFGLGPSHLAFEGGGAGPNPADFKGAGRLEIGDGLLPPLPFLERLDTMLGGGSLVGAAYKAFPIAFNLKATRIILDAIRLEAGPYGMALQGWVDAEGPIGLQLSLLAPREGLDLKELPKEMLDALEQDDGRILIPIHVGGDYLTPEVKVDQRALKAVAKQAIRQEAGKQVGKLLGGLLGRDDG